MAEFNMPLVGFPTPRVRETLKQPVSVWADLFLLLFGGAIVGGLVMIAQEWSTPYQEKIDIDLSLWSLPGYTLLSLSRGLAAYILSLIFTLVYGTIAAHHRRAEQLMIPALDVLQAIPVLGFLPGLVLAMIALFPNSTIGLELACIIMIFTGQVWNMTFSFHASLRRIPETLREAGTIFQFSRGQFFRLVELPAAMIGLIWNSMMSMAGGWFFLTVNEAFTLGHRDYRLPGIGSYMQEAIHEGNIQAMISGIVAMTLMIILVDQLLWNPLVVWSQRFKLEDTGEEKAAQSWVLNLWRGSHFYQGLMQRVRSTEKIGEMLSRQQQQGFFTSFLRGYWHPFWRAAWPVMRWLLLAGLVLAVGWGLWSLMDLLLSLPMYDEAHQEDWLRVILALLASFLRTTSAVALGAAWTLPVGILIGLSSSWSQRLQPVIQVVASFPAPMLFPLVTLLLAVLGIPFTVGCVALMLLGAQWYILFNVIAGARAIPEDLKEVNRVYQVSRWQRWTRLYIPCVFPYLVTGLITAAGGAWNATIVAEFVQIEDQTYTAFGLGSIINQATAGGNYPLLCASVVTMALFVVLLNRFFWKRLYRLAEDRYSLTG